MKLRMMFCPRSSKITNWASGNRAPLKGPIGATIKDLEGYHNIGAFIIRLGFWGILYYHDDKEPPKSYR